MQTFLYVSTYVPVAELKTRSLKAVQTLPPPPLGLPHLRGWRSHHQLLGTDAVVFEAAVFAGTCGAAWATGAAIEKASAEAKMEAPANLGIRLRGFRATMILVLGHPRVLLIPRNSTLRPLLTSRKFLLVRRRVARLRWLSLAA